MAQSPALYKAHGYTLVILSRSNAATLGMRTSAHSSARPAFPLFQRERERQTHRNRNRQIESQKQKERERERERDTHTHTDRKTEETETEKQKRDRQTGRPTGRQRRFGMREGGGWGGGG